MKTKAPLILLLPCLLLSRAYAETLDPALFTGRATITFSGYAGGETLTDFPALVKFARDAPANFLYADCAAGGSDLRFTGADGTVLDHEIDTWDPTGTSLVWVRIPALSGTDTTITAYWGKLGTSTPLPAVTPANVWTRYVSVWHLNTDLGDSGSDANPLSAQINTTCGVPALLGSGCHQDGTSGQYLLTEHPITNANGTARQTFTVSGWFKPEKNYLSSNLRLFSTKENGGHTGAGFEVIIASNKLLMRGNGNGTTYGSYATAWADNFAIGSWTQIAGVFNGSAARSFFNGVEKGGGGTIEPINETTKRMGIGNTGNGNAGTDNVFVGTMDEMRIFDGVPSAAWAKAEYDTVANHAAFTTYSAADITVVTDPRFAASAPAVAGSSITFSGEVSNLGRTADGSSPADSCSIYLAYAPAGTPLPAPSLVATVTEAGGTFSATVGDLAANTDYLYEITAVNSAGVDALDSVTGRFSTNPDVSFSVVSVVRGDNGEIASANLAFGGNPNASATLFAVYGPLRGGSGTAGWASMQRLGGVTGSSAPLSYDFPATWGRNTSFLRFVLVRGRQPDCDDFLEFLTTQGAECVTTDYVPTGASTIETRVKLRNTSANSTIFCARTNQDGNAFTTFYIKNKDNNGWRYDYGTDRIQTTVTADPGTVYDLRMDSTGLQVNGSYVVENTTPRTFVPGNPMQLFASYGNSPSDGRGNWAQLSFYFLRSYDDGRLTHEYLPCVRNGSVCLYDAVEKRFHAASAGLLLAGSTTTPVFTGPTAFEAADVLQESEVYTIFNPAIVVLVL